MAQIDIVIILIAVWGAYRGWKNGFLKEVVSTLGFLLGLFIAYRLYAQFGDFLAPHIGVNSTTSTIVARLIAFMLLWVVSPIVLGLLATLVTKTLKGLHVGFLNSMAGSLLGVVKYVVLLSFIFGAMSMLGIISKEKRDESKCYQKVAAIANSVFKEAQWKRSKKEMPVEEDVADTVWIPIHHESK